MLQQYLPLAVLKPECIFLTYPWKYQLQQCLPLAVLKPLKVFKAKEVLKLQQCLPLAVLKLSANNEM